MATFYWVGGTGSWSDAANHWASVSNGTPGAENLPTSTDDVVFDQNSNAGTGTFTVTVNGTAASPSLCNDFTASGLDGAMTLSMGSTARLNFSGSLTLPVTNLTWAGTSGAVLTFVGTSTGKTITTNGVTLTGTRLFINGVGGGLALGSALTMTVGALDIANGAFDTANYNITGFQLFSNYTSIRSISLGSSSITLSASANTSAVVFSATTGLTFDAGTSTITCSAASSIFGGGGLTFYNVIFSSTASGSTTINGENTFNNLTQASLAVLTHKAVTLTADQIVNGTLTLGTANAPMQRLRVVSSVSGTQRTITAATVATLSDVDFKDIVGAGTGVWAGTRLGNAQNNSGITFAAGVNKYWNLAAGGSWISTAWALSSAGAVNANNFPLAQDTVVIENTGLNTGATISNVLNWYIGTINASGRSNAWTLSLSGTQTILGDLNISSATTLTCAAGTTISFSGYGITQNITTNGVIVTANTLTAEVTGGTVKLLGNLTVAYSSTIGTFSLLRGTFDPNNYNVTCDTFNITNSNVRALSMGLSIFTVNTWNATTVTNLTFSSGTSTINVSSASTSASVFSGGGLTYYNVNFAKPSSSDIAYTINQSNTFNNVSFISPTSNGRANVGVYADQTVNGTLTVTGVSAKQFVVLYAATGAYVTISAAAVSLAYCAFEKIHAAGASINWSGTSLSNYGGNQNIIFGAGKMVYWNQPAGGNWTDNAWALTSGGTPALANYPLGQDTVVIDNTGLNSGSTITVNTGAQIGGFNSSGLTNTGTILSSSSLSVYTGNVSFSPSTIMSGSSLMFIINSEATTQIISGNGATISVPVLKGSFGNAQLASNFTTSNTFYISDGDLNLNNYVLTCNTFNSTFSSVRSIGFGSSGYIEVTGNAATVFSMGSFQNFTCTGVPNVKLTYSGSTGTRTINLVSSFVDESNALNFNITAGSDIVSFASGNVKNIIYSTSFVGTGSLPPTIYGNVTLSPSQSFQSSSALTTFAATSGTQTITSNGVTIDKPIAISAPGATVQLGSALTMPDPRRLQITQGTFDTAGYNLTTYQFVYSYTQALGATINLGSSIVTLIGSSSSLVAFQMGDGKNLTINSGTSEIVFNNTRTTSANAFNGGFKNYYKVTQAGTNLLLVQDAKISILSNTAQPTTINFGTGSSLYVSSFNVSGTSGNIVTLGSNTPGLQAYVKSLDGSLVGTSYCNITDINYSPGNTWTALTDDGNVNGGNNSGITFALTNGVKARLYKTGNFAVSSTGQIDEVTGTTYRITKNGRVEAAEFDEVTSIPVASRVLNTGKIQIAGIFDETDGTI